MRYEIILHNQHANQQLDFVAFDDAIEAAPTLIAPNIPAGGVRAARVRVKSVPAIRWFRSSAAAATPAERSIIPEPTPMGCVSTKSRFFRLSPEVLSPFSAAPRPGPSPIRTGKLPGLSKCFPADRTQAGGEQVRACRRGAGVHDHLERYPIPLDGASFAFLE